MHTGKGKVCRHAVAAYRGVVHGECSSAYMQYYPTGGITYALISDALLVLLGETWHYF